MPYSKIVTFHQSCEFNPFWNNPETKFQADGSQFIHFYQYQVLNIAYTIASKTGTHFTKKRNFLQAMVMSTHLRGPTSMIIS